MLSWTTSCRGSWELVSCQTEMMKDRPEIVDNVNILVPPGLLCLKLDNLTKITQNWYVLDFEDHFYVNSSATGNTWPCHLKMSEISLKNSSKIVPVRNLTERLELNDHLNVNCELIPCQSSKDKIKCFSSKPVTIIRPVPVMCPHIYTKTLHTCTHSSVQCIGPCDMKCGYHTPE